MIVNYFKGAASPINSNAYRIYANDGKEFSTDDNKGALFKLFNRILNHKKSVIE